MITHKELKQLLLYIPETGRFIYKKDGKRNIRGGDIAGRPHSMGYWAIGLKGKSYLAHRLAWFYIHGEWPEQIDHLNHNRSDNRLENLRETDNAGNHRNRPIQANNKSGCPGVYWSTTYNKWISEIKLNGKKRFLGRYVELEDAISARKEANVKYGFHLNHGCA